MKTTTSLQSNLTNEKTFFQNDNYRDTIISDDRSVGTPIPLFLNYRYVNPVESYKTLILRQDDVESKKFYSTEVYRFLDKKYESIGGIDKGKGFKNANDMISNIPIWRLRIKKNRIVSVMMFKVKEYGKKMVAYACIDQLTPEEKKEDFTYILDESYAELSDGLLVAMLKMFSKHLHHYVLKAEHLMKNKKIYSLSNNYYEKLISDSSKRLFLRLKSQWPELLKFCYIRKIGNENKLKLMLGTPEISYSTKHLAFHVQQLTVLK